MMNKIVIFTNTLMSGGAEKQSAFLYNALKKEYPTFLVLWYGKRIDANILNILEANKTDVIKLNGSLISKIFMFYKFCRNEQISHMFTYLTKPNFLGAIIGRIGGVKYIYSGIRTTKLPKWKLLLEKITVNYISKSAVINNYSGNILFKKYGLKNLHVITNCFPSIATPINRSKKDVIKIITVGRFVEDKDYYTAIKAISELKKKFDNFVFQIIGYGVLEHDIRYWIKEVDIEKQTEIIINPPNIQELLNDADVYLSTSLFEGTSNSIMEAMNASLPIVATNVGDNNQLVENGKSGFLNEIKDYKGLAVSLFKLVKTYNLRIAFGLRSNQILQQVYSIEKFKESYIKLIEQK